MAEETKEKVETKDIQAILSKFDCYDRIIGELYKNREMQRDLSSEELAKWNFEKDSDQGNINQKNTGNSATKLIDIDKYWNFYGVETPKVDVEFLVGLDESNQKKWININYNKDTLNNNFNNYFVSATIVDKGFKELELVLYDRTFISIQKLISASINFVDNKLNQKDENDIKSYETSSGYFDQAVQNGPKLEFFVSPEKISTNIRIRYGYNEDKNTTVTDKYSGLGSGNNNSRWKFSEGEEKITKRDEETTSIKEDVVLTSHYQQATLFSSWDEFYITGLTSTLTDTGIKYTIKAVSVDEFSLNGYKMIQQYSKIAGKPKTVMATLMNMFNENEAAPIKLVWADDEVKSTDSAINGVSTLMNYKTGKYENVTEEDLSGKDGMVEKINKAIEGNSENLKLLKDILACFENVQENSLNTYSNGQSVFYGSNIGILLKEGILSFANIPEKRSYLDFVAWPFNKNDKLENLSISKDYSSSIIKMAKFQKDISNNYGILLDILKNKEEGYDTKSLIFIKDMVKIWLANIAIEAYSIGSNSGKISIIGNIILNNQAAGKKIKEKVTQIEEIFKVYNGLPLRWAYTEIEDVLAKEFLDYEGRFYNPGHVDEYTDQLHSEEKSQNTSKKDLTAKKIINAVWAEPSKIQNSAEKADVILSSLIEYKSLQNYETLNILSNQEGSLQKIFGDGAKCIKPSSDFYKEETTNSKDLKTLYSVYKNNYIPNPDKKTGNYLEFCRNLLDKFGQMKNISEAINADMISKDIGFTSNGVDKKKIFLKHEGSYDLYTVNNFSLPEDPQKLTIEYVKSTESDYLMAIRDGVEGHNYFSLRFKTKDEDTLEILKLYIFNSIKLGLDLLNCNNIILGTEFINLEIINNRKKTLEEGSNVKNNEVKGILEEYNEALDKVEKVLLKSREGLDELLKEKNENNNKLNENENELKEYNYLKELFEEEINNLNDNANLMQVIVTEGSKEKEGELKEVCSNDIKSQNYGIDKNKITPDRWKGNYLLDAFTLMNDPKTNLSDMGSFASFLKKDIEKVSEDLENLKKKLTKIDASNIGKEIELSLGSKESQNTDIKITKTLSSLLNDFCSQCQPRETINLETKNSSEMTIRDGNGDSKKVNVYDDTPKYNLSWGIVGHYNKEKPIIGLYYRKPKNLKRIRMYNWGTGNPKAHCIKSLSISNSNEFAMMHSFNEITTKDSGMSATINSAGGSLEINDFMPTKTPCFFAVDNDSSRDKILLNNTLNSIANGTITLLGDPSLKFFGTVQPFTYPIYINIKLQQESSWYSNKGEEKALTYQLSGYYIVTQITHNISASGYTTTLNIMKYPGSNDSVNFKSTSSALNNANSTTI